MTKRDAIKFLVDEILNEAARRGTVLSEVERQMLFFDETASSDRMIEPMEEFDRECDDQAYERKIADLIRAAHTRADPAKRETWKGAVAKLASTDAYLGVMAGQAGLGGSSAGEIRLFLGLVALLAVWYFTGFTLARLFIGADPSSAEIFYYAWLAALVAAAVYTIARYLFGADRVDRLIDVVIGPLLGSKRGK